MIKNKNNGKSRDMKWNEMKLNNCLFIKSLKINCARNDGIMLYNINKEGVIKDETK